jgi:uncharacterized membrane protein
MSKSTSLFKRFIQHIKPQTYQSHFNSVQIAQLKAAIKAAEHGHRGEIRLVIEARLPLSDLRQGKQARERAVHWFSQLRVWDTQENTGILLYLLLAEHKIEIVADRGIASKVPQVEWDAICQTLQQQLKQENYLVGITNALHAFGLALENHFPLNSDEANPDELCNEPLILL